MARQPKFTKQEFIDFALNLIKQSMSNIKSIEQGSNDLVYRIHLTNRGTTEISFENLWVEYQKHGDINQIIKYAEINFETNNFIEDAFENGLHDLSKRKYEIFPTIRNTHYLDGKIPIESGVRPVSQLIGARLSLFYIIDNPKFMCYIVSNMLDEEVNEQTIYNISAQNSIRQGWIKPMEVIDNDAGKLMIFEETDKMLMGQFFIKELAEKNIGKQFFCSFPTAKIALIYKPSLFLSPQLLKSGLIAFKQITQNLFIKEAYEMNPMIHEYNNGTIREIG